jgi:hypothetical protein
MNLDNLPFSSLCTDANKVNQMARSIATVLQGDRAKSTPSIPRKASVVRSGAGKVGDRWFSFTVTDVAIVPLSQDQRVRTLTFEIKF